MFHPECRDILEGHNFPQLVYCLRVVQSLLHHPPRPLSHVPLDENILQRLEKSMMECKMPQFDCVNEVVQNFKHLKGNNKHLTPMKPKKATQFSVINKENVCPLSKSPGRSLKNPPCGDKPALTPRKEWSLHTSPMQTPSQIIHKFNNAISLSARQQLQTNTPQSNATAMNAPSSVGDWIKQQRKVNIPSTKNSNKRLFTRDDDVKFQFSQTQPSLHDQLDDVLCGVDPITDANDGNSGGSSREFSGIVPSDYVPPPPNFSTGADYSLNTPSSYATNMESGSSVASPSTRTTGPIPSLVYNSADIAVFSNTARDANASRMSISVPTSPFRAGNESSNKNNSAFSFDDLTVVVNNLAEVRRCPSASSLTVLDAEPMSEGVTVSQGQFSIDNFYSGDTNTLLRKRQHC